MSLSNLKSQILEAQFQIYVDGSIDSFVTLDIQNEAIEIVPVFWNNSKDVALSGNKRSNIRDLDMRITLDYEASLEPDKVEQLFDALVNLDANNYELRFKPSVDSSEYVEIIPSDGLALLIEYDNTVRRGGSSGVIPNLVFESRSYESTVDDFFQPI